MSYYINLGMFLAKERNALKVHTLVQSNESSVSYVSFMELNNGQGNIFVEEVAQQHHLWF